MSAVQAFCLKKSRRLPRGSTWGRPAGASAATARFRGSYLLAPCGTYTRTHKSDATPLENTASLCQFSVHLNSRHFHLVPELPALEDEVDMVQPDASFCLSVGS